MPFLIAQTAEDARIVMIVPSSDEIIVDVGPVSKNRVDQLMSVSIAFLVTSALEPLSYDSPGQSEMRFAEHAIDQPYVKNYDLVPGGSPLEWTRRFETSNWRTFIARCEGRSIGAAALACRTDGVDLLEGRDDLGVVWDIRVAPDWRGRKVGTRLFSAVESAGRSMGLTQLKIETQNINASACRFYQRMGCRLAAINANAYPELPEEIQLLWSRDL